MNLLHVNDQPGSYPPSWYAATADLSPKRPRLTEGLKADVCIVGAGYTGLSAAASLAARGYSVVVLEAQRVGFGASGRNGGQVGSGQRLDQDWIEARFVRAEARLFWDLAEEAKSMVRDIARDAPSVDWQDGVIHAFRKPAEVEAARRYAEKLARDYGYEGRIRSLDRLETAAALGTDAYAGGEIDLGAGNVHPLNFVLALAQRAEAAGARIFEESEVLELEEGASARLRTAAGEVTAAHVILACNGYLGRLQPKVAARVMPINNFIVATEPLGTLAPMPSRHAVADSRFVVNYWRQTADGRMLFGGGESYGYRFPDIEATVRKPMLEVYPQLAGAKIDYAWGGTLAITTTRAPCFLRLAPNMLSASGYSGHGVALATLAGRLMAEAVAGQAERFDLMSRLPTPAFPGGARLRHPILVLAMTWFSLRDRLGF